MKLPQKASSLSSSIKATFVILFLALLGLPTGATEDSVDLNMVHSIKEEAFQNGHVMDHLFQLSDLHGPRLTGSPEFLDAANWVVQQLKEWGISAQLEPWGDFGRSWSLRRFRADLTQPRYMPLIAFPKAWTSGTSGPVHAQVVYAPFFQNWEDDMRRDPSKILERLAKYSAEQKGKLRGKIVLLDPIRKLKPATDAALQRMDENELTAIGMAPSPFRSPSYEWPITALPDDPEKRKDLYASLPLEVREDFWEHIQESWDRFNAFLKEEGVIAAFSADNSGSGGIMFVGRGGSPHTGAPVPPPLIVVEPEQYFRMARLVENKIPVEVDLQVDAEFKEGPVQGINVIGEIPGAGKKNEVVMLGGHLDSWHSGTGATDNAAGCAIAMETLRILKSLNARLDRTVRLALWSGEEQGLYGSRYYVKKHFGDAVTMKVLREHAGLSGYFNVDNGAGKIRGVYLQGNDMMRPIFQKWFEPFKDLGVETITIRDTGGTDHLSFDAVGLPGFQFVQDELDYETRTHHSNVDTYDHADPADMMQASAILASIVYDAANRPEMLPRKPLPKPLPPKKNN